MKRTIALVTGGFTGESVISLQSAEMISRNLDRTKYDVYQIEITPQSWFYADEHNVRHEIDRNTFTLLIAGKLIRFDCVFVALHGSPGEDGKLQGYFDMLGLPYTTCDATTSAITMNKGYTKAIVAGAESLYVARSVQLFGHQANDVRQIASKLNFPLFVKPNSGGSSIGMSKVNGPEALPEALEKAFNEDTQVLVEEYIRGREFTIGVYRAGGELAVLPATEIISSKEFFDFEAKYTLGVSQEITPGRMSDEEQKRVQHIVKEVYRKLNCRGVVRIDFILQEDSGRFYFIEINTVPGQSANSIIPQQVRAAGKDIGEFYSRLVDEAISGR